MLELTKIVEPLPPKYAELLIERCTGPHRFTRQSAPHNLIVAVSSCFKWEHTPEGHTYWDRFRNLVVMGCYLEKAYDSLGNFQEYKRIVSMFQNGEKYDI